jgi:MinD-like ATPase involved in chromosome partitioning or flagellar assembly
MPRAEVRRDQAAGLRRLFAPAAPAVVVVAQTSTRSARLAANLAAAVAALGTGTLVIDESCGSVARLLGLSARWELAHVLAGDLGLDRALLSARPGIALLPANRGLAIAVRNGLTLATLWRHAVLPELVVCHCADARLAAQLAAQPVASLLVVDGEADSLANAYLALKSADAEVRPALLGHWEEGRAAPEAVPALAAAARRFLGREVPFAGVVPDDAALAQAARRGRSVFEIDPEAASAQSLRALAHRLRRPDAVPGAMPAVH